MSLVDAGGPFEYVGDLFCVAVDVELRIDTQEGWGGAVVSAGTLFGVQAPGRGSPFAFGTRVTSLGSTSAGAEMMGLAPRESCGCFLAVHEPFKRTISVEC